MTNTNTVFPLTAQGKVDPVAFYDAFMEMIDPDLTSTNRAALDKRYANETPAEHWARLQRHAESFQIFSNLVDDISAATKEYEAATQAAVTTPDRRVPILPA